MIKSFFAGLTAIALLTGCAAPRQQDLSFAGGTGDTLSQARGYQRSFDYPENDYRNILSDPGHF